MPFHYRKSIRLGKHIRINVSKSGVGMSAGVQGARISVGPRGTRLTSSIPGTGISYLKQLSNNKSARAQATASPPPPRLTQPKPPTPGFLASRHEKDLYNGLTAYQSGQAEKALQHFLAAAPKEVGAALMAATILATREGREAEAIQLLEQVIQSDAEFPTPLMQKYVTASHIAIGITPNVVATVQLDGLGAALLLAELYQEQHRVDEAIGLLEELDDLANEPVLTLSLCELYAMRQLWDGVIERGSNVQVEDDITLETVILYARALQVKELHEAAIDVLTTAFKKKKDRSVDLLREAAYLRALSYEANGKKSQANKEFQKLYAESPTYRDVAQRLGVA